jgi:hypothetical protein
MIVKRSVVRAPVDESMTAEDAEVMAEEYSGHSLRAGHATSAAQNDAPRHVIQRQLRPFNTTAGCIREGRLFKGSSASFALRSPLRAAWKSASWIPVRAAFPHTGPHLGYLGSGAAPGRWSR